MFLFLGTQTTSCQSSPVSERDIITPLMKSKQINSPVTPKHNGFKISMNTPPFSPQIQRNVVEKYETHHHQLKTQIYSQTYQLQTPPLVSSSSLPQAVIVQPPPFIRHNIYNMQPLMPTQYRVQMRNNQPYYWSQINQNPYFNPETNTYINPYRASNTAYTLLGNFSILEPNAQSTPNPFQNNCFYY
jgi:hypothetical protein